MSKHHIRLYSAYVLPVFLYGAETWTLTKAMAAKVDAFDQWCQRRILRIHYSQHVTTQRFAAAPAASHYLRSSAPECSTGLGMLPPPAHTLTTPPLPTLPFTTHP